MDSALGSLVKSFELALVVEGLRPATVYNHRLFVRRFAETCKDCAPGQITHQHIREYVASIQDQYSAKTIREVQLSLRRFFRFLVEEGEIRHNPALDIKLTKVRRRPQPTYTEREVDLMYAYCPAQTLEGVRDRAMVLTLYDTACRVGELVSMGLPNTDTGAVLVQGKTGFRQVPLSAPTLQALDRYIRRWRVEDGLLWQGIRGSMTRSGVLQAINRICDRARVQRKGVHAFRRGAAVAMRRAGMNDSDIMEVAGWKTHDMVLQYTAAQAKELAWEAHKRAGHVNRLFKGSRRSG